MSMLPSIPVGVQPAKLYLIRPSTLVSAGVASELYFNGQLVCRLGVGDYTIFPVSPGVHMIGCKLNRGDGQWFESQKIECESGKDYYFRTIAAVVPIPSAEGIKLTEHLNYIPLE